MRWLRAFRSVLLALATVAGFYVGAKSVQLLWLFYVSVPAAALAATAYRTYPHLRAVREKLSAHDRMLATAATLQRERDDLRGRLVAMEAEQLIRMQEARAEGRSLAAGAVRAALAGADLELAGMAIRDGALLFAASVSEGRTPGVGAVYALALGAPALRVRQGLVRVAEVTEGGGKPVVLLECIEEDVPEFWQSLRDQALIGQAPPKGIALSIPALDELPELQEGLG